MSPLQVWNKINWWHRKHIRTKHEIRCPHCSFVTYLKEDLENHLRNKHEKKEPKCDYCEFIGKTSSGLKAHLTKMHTGVKKFKCFTCDFCCETKVELVTHNDIYWYSHRQCLNRDHERYILGEFVQLEQDGFKVHRKLTGLVVKKGVITIGTNPR